MNDQDDKWVPAATKPLQRTSQCRTGSPTPPGLAGITVEELADSSDLRELLAVIECIALHHVEDLAIVEPDVRCPRGDQAVALGRVK
jgi:hypothetical protein